MYYVYVLQSIENKKLYVGRTSNLRQRVKQHQVGKNWTTRRIKANRLVFYEAFSDQQDSIRRESYFKTSKGKSSLKQIIRNSLIVLT